MQSIGNAVEFPHQVSERSRSFELFFAQDSSHVYQVNASSQDGRYDDRLAVAVCSGDRYEHGLAGVAMSAFKDFGAGLAAHELHGWIVVVQQFELVDLGSDAGEVLSVHRGQVDQIAQLPREQEERNRLRRGGHVSARK